MLRGRVGDRMSWVKNAWKRFLAWIDDIKEPFDCFDE